MDRIIGFQVDDEDVSMSSVAGRVRIKREPHSDCQSELDFLASHFFEVELRLLDVMLAMMLPHHASTGNSRKLLKFTGT